MGASRDTQTGEHTPVFDTESADWKEMKKAMSYATGIEQDNMIVYWVTSDKTTSNAWIGTVHSKDKQNKYRVYIKWVDDKGWMPTKMEELAELKNKKDRPIIGLSLFFTLKMYYRCKIGLSLFICIHLM